MTKVEAIIEPFELDDAKDALLEIGVVGLTMSEVRGFGRQRDGSEIYRGAEYGWDFVPKYKLEIVVPDDAVEKVNIVLLEVCGTGRNGDGLIAAQPVDDAIRIRTGDTGEVAIAI